MKYVLILLLFTACGSSDKKELVIDEPTIDTVHIYQNTNAANLNGLGSASGFDAVYLTATYSQADRDRVEACNFTCFVLTDSMILGDDKDCANCLRLSVALNYLNEQGIDAYIRADDSLSFNFAQTIVSEFGYTATFASNDVSVLEQAQYNYPVALVSLSGDYQESSNIDYYIVNQSSIGKCERNCIAINLFNLSIVDGTVYGVIYE